jgi:hypothetical protein
VVGRVVSSDVVRAPYLLYLLIFRAYINEMHGSKKISVKNFVRQRCAGRFNSGVKGLNLLRNVVVGILSVL